MNTGQVIEVLLKTGMAAKSGFEEARRKNASLAWNDFARSEAFKNVQQDTKKLIDEVTQEDITKAVERIRSKQQAFLAGREISELPLDELLRFGKLADAESILVRKEMKKLGASATFLGWLSKEALPILADVAKVVIPLVL